SAGRRPTFLGCKSRPPPTSARAVEVVQLALRLNWSTAPRRCRRSVLLRARDASDLLEGFFRTGRRSHSVPIRRSRTVTADSILSGRPSSEAGCTDRLPPRTPAGLIPGLSGRLALLAKTRILVLALLVALAAAARVARADVKVSSPIGDHMVMQQS